MKNGKIEKGDSEIMMGIYWKINLFGNLDEPLTVEEQVFLFAMGKYLEEVERKIRE